MARPVSRAELARMFGFSRAAATKRCQGAWAAACDRDRVDADHPLIRAAALKKGIDIGSPAATTDQVPTAEAKAGPARAAAPTHVEEPATLEPAKPTARRRKAEPETVDFDSPEGELERILRPLPPQPANAGTQEDISELARTLRPLLARFGTGRGLRDYLVSLKDAETILTRQFERAKAKGAYISREFVEAHVFGLIEGANHRLISDTPKTLCRELYALARSGAPLEEAESFTRKLLGKQLESVKTKAATGIRNAGADRGHSGRSGLAGQPGHESDDRNGAAKS